MAKRHVVEVVESFEHTFEIGALVVQTVNGGNSTIAPSETRTTKYTAGEQCKFNNKKEAEAFAKHHGSKMRYIGKIDV